MTAKPLFVLGLMSGTSADGIDVALARISGAPPHLNAKLLGHTSSQFPPALRKEILRVAEQKPVSAGELSQLNFRLGHIFADAALDACRRFRVSPKRVALIGSHGQTIFHQGQPANYFGSPTASTLQIGEGSVIAARIGITTISDFRPADMALGGQGAPLVPFADYALYRHPEIGRVSLNIGGIANVTVIPAGARPDQVFAFDTGPGNMLIDALVQHFTHGRQRFDKDARLAKSGQIDRYLIRRLLRDPYLKQAPPKSTGREYYGSAYVKDLLVLGRHKKIRPNDLLYTVTVFTAYSIINALHRFVFPKHKINEVIVSGGGAQNPLIFEQLIVFAMSGADPLEYYSDVTPRELVIAMRVPKPSKAARSQATEFLPEHGLISVVPSSHFGIPEDAKEAFAFALLAYETFHQRPANLPSATGARGPAILGKISYAPPR
jgi:anhydro-N-acetylmuramic acid kinase